MKKGFFTFIFLLILNITPIQAQTPTPSQQEGPYYPLEKPADRDNDLTLIEGSSQVAAGSLLLLSGKVLDVQGQAVEGVTVEIWQTDTRGAYLHPNDPATTGRDKHFQFYGEVVSAEDGSYSFRTILPRQYEPRPRHIHFKVKYEGKELLTSQFYFKGYKSEEDVREPEMLVVALNKVKDDIYAVAYEGGKDIILNK